MSEVVLRMPKCRNVESPYSRLFTPTGARAPVMAWRWLMPLGNGIKCVYVLPCLKGKYAFSNLAFPLP